MVNLKELCLEECTFFHLKTLRISGPQLLQLTMLNVVYIYFTTDVPFRLGSFGLEILAPKVKRLTFKCKLPDDFSQLDLPSLQHADVSVIRQFTSWGIDEGMTRNVLKLLHGICNAQFLQLSGITVEILAAFPQLLEQQSSSFRRLKSLELEVLPNKNYLLALPGELLAYFLQGSPSAQIKIIDPGDKCRSGTCPYFCSMLLTI
ncbi:hypothetical protein Tsubulata_048102 [Turnera subulata]|uniref:FBD domain-containing protein n=1 Tax=Turnera subulata TaxID=218843 RepID=A0A9Q0G0Y3_9ROSI|nr:hypothetical protein Tsubulata_048102 [Turnera subulata]